MNSILGGIRVLDFGRYVAGPYCATLLGYLGAEVIRVEKRAGGEDRYIAPVAPSGEGGVFLQTACNKKSFTLDPSQPEAREITHRLAATADVVVANLTSAALQKMGLDYETLRGVKPDIILTQVTAFGTTGPYRDRGGFDGIGQAMSGAMYMTGVPGKPVKAAAPYVDYSTAVLSAFGTLAALMERERTGRGQQVQTTLLGTALAAFNSHLIEQGVAGINRTPTGNRVQTSAPSDVFATRDGHLLTHVVGPGLFQRWARLMGQTGWLDDPRFATDQGRGDHRDLLCERMARWCAERSTDDALEALEAAGIPAGPVLDLQEALDHPQTAAMGFLSEVAFPGLARPAPVAGLPITLTSTPGGIRQRPPTLGEHTEEILHSLGYTQREITALQQRKVV